MSKQYIIYTKELAYKLRKEGFKIIEVGINKKYPQYDTYIFEDTPDFQKCLHALTKKK